MKSTGVIRNIEMVGGKKVDILIEKGVIKKIAAPNSIDGELLFNGKHSFISSGWIDLHVHGFSDFSPYGDNIDDIGIKQGVTTIVDAGSCGANRIDELYNRAQSSKTNVFSFLNISRIGLERIDELSNLDWINIEACHDAVHKYKDMIIGLKARISSSVVKGNGITPLQKAVEIGNDLKLPIMTHIGSAPPKIEDVIPLLRKGDIITHFLNGKENNLFDNNGNPLNVLKDAISRGVNLDVGHGNASFSFEVAKSAKKHDIHFNTISSDIYKKNRLEGPVFSLSNVLSKFINLGYSLEEVINAVTINPAHIINKKYLSDFTEGQVANLTIFDVADKEVELIDSDRKILKGTKLIKERGVLANGEFFEL